MKSWLWLVLGLIVGAVGGYMLSRKTVGTGVK